jgi:hypothetical protein
MYVNTDAPFYAKDMVLSDLNNDQLPDLLAGCYTNPNAVLINDGGRCKATPSCFRLLSIQPAAGKMIFLYKPDAWCC